MCTPLHTQSCITFVHTGTSSPHWINQTNLNDVLADERENHNKQMQNIWAISTHTFDHNNTSQTSPTATPISRDYSGVGDVSPRRVEDLNRETDDGDKTTSMSDSTSPQVDSRGHIKPNRAAPAPPKTRRKSKGAQSQSASSKESEYHDPVPYVYPLHKAMLNTKTHATPSSTSTATAAAGSNCSAGGNQNHEYAQPHAIVHTHSDRKQLPVNRNKTKHEYHPIDPKLQQPTGQYQDLLTDGLPRGQSLPTISTFATLNS